MSKSFSTLKIFLAFVSVCVMIFSSWGAQPAQAAGSLTITDCTDLDIATDINTLLASAGTVMVTFQCNAPTTSPIMLSATLLTASSGTVTIKADPGYDVALSGGGTLRVLKVAGGSAKVTLDNLTIMNGYSGTVVDSGYGGGVLVSGGTLTVNNVTFTGNTAQGGRGGAILNLGILYVNNSTFFNNTAMGAGSYSGGGAVYNGSTSDAAAVDITNSTFYNNTAASTNANAGGGAIYNNSAGNATITNSTLYGNPANSHVGGGVYMYYSATSTGTTTLTNSIVARTATSIDSNCAGTLTLNTNVSGGDSTCAAASSTLTAIFGEDGPKLADNGGKTQTFAIPNSGPAYNLSDGVNPVTTCPANDQRGVPRSRTAGDACDAGSYEYHTASTTVLTASPTSPTYGETITLTATVTTGATGNVEFYNGTTGALLGTVALSSGQATYPLGVLNAGSYSYSAVYAGDTVYDTSKSSRNLTVNPVIVTVTPKSGQSKVFGSADPVFEYTWAPSSLPSSAFTGLLSRETGENVGSAYKITKGSLALTLGNNYALSFTQNVTFAITPLTVTVTPNSGQNKVYGSADPVFLYTWLPASVPSSAFTGLLSRDPGQDVSSTYKITKGSLDLGSNYTLNFTPNVTFAITPLTVTVTPNSGQSKPAGAVDPVLTYGVVPALVGTDKFSGALEREAGETMGDYKILKGNLALSSNYTLNFTSNVIFKIVEPVTVTVTPVSGQSKVYGANDPKLNFTWSPDTVPPSAFTGALDRTAGEHVGDYNINQGTLTATGGYVLDFSSTVVTFEIKPLAVTVTPVSGQSKVYGGVDPSKLDYTVEPALVGSDTFIGALTRNAGESAGPYAITQGTLALSSDYILTFATGVNFTITPAELTVKADNMKRFVLKDNPDFTYTITGFVNGEKEADIVTGNPVLDTPANNTSPVGDYEITVATGTLALKSGNNYTFHFVSGTLTVMPSHPLWMPIILRQN